MRHRILLGTVFAIIVAACTPTGATSRTVFEPLDGLECPTDYWWGEFGSIAVDAKGLPTREQAIESAYGNWTNRQGGELQIVEVTKSTVGVLVVDGHRVVLFRPSPAPAGGFLIVQTVGCEGFERH